MSKTEPKCIKDIEGENAVCIPITHRESIQARYVFICEFLKRKGYIGNNRSSKNIIRAIKIFLTASKKRLRLIYIVGEVYYNKFKDDDMNNGWILNGISLIIGIRLLAEYPNDVKVFYEVVDEEYTVVIRYFGEKIYVQQELRHYLRDCTGEVPFLPKLTQQVKSDRAEVSVKQTDAS